tara:strand:- start:1472 stop:3091 length:1620 start_codon:yes stop_codon:yes gene_type:complete
MDKYFLFSVMRQMRRPIITIIIYYMIAVLGLVLIPGVDSNGQEYHLGFFHAFYVIVYTSTTIGFGEIPYEWTDNQRLWVLMSAITGVVLWVYSMGKIISLSQNQVFKEQIEEYRFENRVKKIKKPFYIIVGYGVTGKIILDLFRNHKIDVVLIDRDSKVFDNMKESIYDTNNPYISADATNLNYLKKSGLKSKFCKGILVMSGSEEANVNIALSAKLIAPTVQTFVRAENQKNINNLSSFDVDHVVSSTKNFSEDIFMLLSQKEEYNLKQKLNNEVKNFEYVKGIPEGNWVICGYNSITKKIINHLIKKNIDYKIIEDGIIENKLIQGRQIKGGGVSNQNLKAAGIENASVVFAASEDDFKNLSTIISAKKINENIYTIAKQNKFYKKELFDNLNINLVYQPQYSIATKVHSLIAEPFLNIFYNELKNLDYEKIKRLEMNLNNSDIETWHFRINNEKSFYKELKNKNLFIDDIIPHQHNIKPLMIYNKNYVKIEPKRNTKIKEGDVLLFSGNYESFCRQQLLMYNKNIYQEYQFRKNKG